MRTDLTPQPSSYLLTASKAVVVTMTRANQSHETRDREPIFTLPSGAVPLNRRVLPEPPHGGQPNFHRTRTGALRSRPEGTGDADSVALSSVPRGQSIAANQSPGTPDSYRPIVPSRKGRGLLNKENDLNKENEIDLPAVPPRNTTMQTRIEDSIQGDCRAPQSFDAASLSLIVPVEHHVDAHAAMATHFDVSKLENEAESKSWTIADVFGSQPTNVQHVEPSAPVQVSQLVQLAQSCGLEVPDDDTDESVKQIITLAMAGKLRSANLDLKEKNKQLEIAQAATEKFTVYDDPIELLRQVTNIQEEIKAIKETKNGYVATMVQVNECLQT